MTAPVAFCDITQVSEHQALWHADPVLEAFVRDIFERAKPDVFVETGTHLGWTSRWVAVNYPDVKVRTVEADARFLGSIRANLGEFGDRVQWAHDDSVNWLWKLLPELQAARQPLFWLDAHWHPPVPLREECRIVATLDRYICLIDDFQCWGPDFSGDTFYARQSLDYTKDGAEGGGDRYHNDLSYTREALYGRIGRYDTHPTHYRPAYEPKPGNNGVGFFIEDFEPEGWYVPPSTWRRETWDQFLASRPATAYPMHPSDRNPP